jgi:hypothetical protein
MSPMFSAVLTSSLFLMFLSFLSTKIEGTVTWNWFLVFLPLFMLQTFYLIDVVTLISKKSIQTKSMSLFVCAFFLVLLFTFEILLCLKLEAYTQMKLTYIFIPLWTNFSIMIIYLIIKLAK